MELIDARERADTIRQYSPEPEEDAVVILDNRISELEVQRDELLNIIHLLRIGAKPTIRKAIDG